MLVAAPIARWRRSAEDLIVDDESVSFVVGDRYDHPSTTSASDAREAALAEAGASRAIDCDGQWYARRDAADTRIIDSAASGGGGFITNPSDVTEDSVARAPQAGCHAVGEA